MQIWQEQTIFPRIYTMFGYIYIKLFSVDASQIDNTQACENSWRDNSKYVENDTCNYGWHQNIWLLVPKQS